MEMNPDDKYYIKAARRSRWFLLDIKFFFLIEKSVFKPAGFVFPPYTELVEWFDPSLQLEFIVSSIVYVSCVPIYTWEKKRGD